MAMSTLSQKPWWMEPENFDAPMVVYLEEEQEEQIFDECHSDAHLRCIEVHSQTLIQLESWFTATGQTRVTVVGPPRARQWLMDMIWSLGSPDSCIRARGREMLRRVQSRLLTEDDLAVPCGVRPDTGREPPTIGMSVTTSLELPLDPNLKSRDCFQFHWSSLYP